jgi:hypothetical protein
MSHEIEQITEEAEEIEGTRDAEVQAFKDEIKNIVNSAGKRRLSIKEFAIEIWENVLLWDVHYLGFASLLLESATGLQLEACFIHIEEMIEATVSGDLQTTEGAIILMADGLVKYQKPLPKLIT